MTKDEGMAKLEGRKARADDLFWDNVAGLVREEPETKRVYDLEERTARFGEAIIDFAKTIPQNPVTNRIITQLVGAGTSVGTNYVEADDAVSKKGIPEKHRNLPEGSPRNQAFPSDDCKGCSGIEAASSNALARIKGTASDLLQDLEKQVRD
jgi:hypothetical protein